jgi:predicted DNA-binding protein (UPF0251 family)
MSPRRKRNRRVEAPPVVKGFKPFGVPRWMNDSLVLNIEEYEAFQLVCYKNLPQEDAAKIMNVSRPTFTRVYNMALKKISEAFAEGKSIVIEGGDVHFDKEWYRCNQCNLVFSSDSSSVKVCGDCNSENLESINKSLEEWQLGKNKSNSDNSDETGYCVCPECNYKQPHQRGVPCYQLICPECNTKLMRGEE